MARGPYRVIRPQGPQDPGKMKVDAGLVCLTGQPGTNGFPSNSPFRPEDRGRTATPVPSVDAWRFDPAPG